VRLQFAHHRWTRDRGLYLPLCRSMRSVKLRSACCWRSEGGAMCRHNHLAWRAVYLALESTAWEHPSWPGEAYLEVIIERCATNNASTVTCSRSVGTKLGARTRKSHAKTDGNVNARFSDSMYMYFKDLTSTRTRFGPIRANSQYRNTRQDS
jgi:hypothetical protein